MLARHFRTPLPLLGPDKAIEYATRAGHEALADLAFEDAAAFFGDALRRYEEYSPPTTTGSSTCSSTSRPRSSWSTSGPASRPPAERSTTPAPSARPRGSGGRWRSSWSRCTASTRSRTRSSRSSTRRAPTIGDDHPALRARLLAFEAFKYGAFQLRGRDGHALAVEAVAAARVGDDPVTLSDALSALAVTLEGTADVGRASRSATSWSDSGPDGRPATAFGLRVLAGVQLELGEPEGLTARSTRWRGTAERWLPAHVYAAQWRTTQALLEGRFADARSTATSSAASPARTAARRACT